jgi:hypothetical protein
MRICVTKKAVVRRLQRFLLPKGRRLRIATHREQKRWGVGRFYLRDAEGIVDKDVNIENTARELGLLDPWETLQK